MDLNKWKKAKERNKMTITEIAERAGLPKRTVQNIFSGHTHNPHFYTVQAIERALGLEPSAPNEVAFHDNYPSSPPDTSATSTPNKENQDLDDEYIYISYKPSEEYFAMRVHGDGMKYAGIFDKSVVVCHKQRNADSGEIVVAMLNGEPVVRRLKFVGDNIILMPENPEFDPIFVTDKDELLILGQVVEMRSKPQKVTGSSKS